ncbi:MAG: ATP-binding protein [Gemmatimonadota bacterium]|nr:ATP-binding protein [Gemmatimonadota bacterium]
MPSAGTIASQVAELVQASEEEGGPDPVVGEVVLQVDYQIIEHFSEHLYASPNKAVEELVANSFDAFATDVRVFTPGKYTADRIIVWDNGESMDIEGLQQLWWIAKSPRAIGDRIEQRSGRTRKIIGKFGIGKLASYSVGQVISHVCRHQGEYYLVSIDYGRLSGNNNEPPVSAQTPIRAPVINLGREAAIKMLRALFHKRPPSMEQMLQEESWTFAVIEELKHPELPSGRLKWVLGNGMPLRPDFAIRVNEGKVSSRLNRASFKDWTFGSNRILDAVKSRWNDAVKSGEASPIVECGYKRGLDPNSPSDDTPFIRFKHLGMVWGNVRLFDETLLKYRSADRGRSHGFFLVVRGRLLNPDDEQLFLPDPSFQTFYRSQFIVYADDLDDYVLADRERLRNAEAVDEFALLQRALAGVARTTVEAHDAEKETRESTRSILPLGSRVYFRDPINALLLKTPIEEIHSFDPAAVRVERRELGKDGRISEVAVRDGEIQVNTSHPYYSIVSKRAGQSKAARESLRTLDLLAISERLLEGHLLDIGLPETDITEVVGWREGLLRQLARSYEESAAGCIDEMDRSSYVGGRRFEKALGMVFEEMGFYVEHDGRSGEKDVLVVATVGSEGYEFTVEAKGSAGAVRNEDANVGAAASHRNQVGASHAVIVAREFAGFRLSASNETAALYKECEATGGVSIMQIEALEAIHTAVMRFSYPLALLRDVFTMLQTPAAKLTTVGGLAKPDKDFDYSELLENIWTRQAGAARSDVVPYRAIFQDGSWKGRGMRFEDFQRKLVALDTLAAGRIVINTVAREVYLRQAPDLILAQIERTLQGKGHQFPSASTTAREQEGSG